MGLEMRVRAFFRCLFFPPRCCACGSFLQEHLLDTEPRALCEPCRRKWELAKLATCRRCGEELSRCRCMSRVLKNAGASVLLKAVSYDKTRDSIARRCVLFMKRHNSRAAFSYFADELSLLLKDYLAETYTAENSILVTYVPRGKRAVRKEGFDQSELLACGVSEALGCDFARLLGRRHGRLREQKRLGKEDRLANAKDAFLPESRDWKHLNGQYRCLVLVDDVVTTGATLSACVRLLRREFHGRIVCLCLAKRRKPNFLKIPLQFCYKYCIIHI